MVHPLFKNSDGSAKVWSLENESRQNGMKNCDENVERYAVPLPSASIPDDTQVEMLCDMVSPSIQFVPTLIIHLCEWNRSRAESPLRMRNLFSHARRNTGRSNNP